MVSKGRFLASGLLALSLLGTGGAVTLAQSNPGLVIFSGVRDRSRILNYHLDFGGRRNSYDRYRLRIPAKKVELGIQQFAISYPDYFYKQRGKFDLDDIEVGYGGGYNNKASIADVEWDKENHILKIYLTEPIEAKNKIEIKLSNVRNPSWGGTFYFNCRVLSPGDVPLPRNLGTWIVSID